MSVNLRRKHKALERALRKKFAVLPPHFKFKVHDSFTDTFNSITLPAGYTKPTQSELETQFNTEISDEQDRPFRQINGVTMITDDLEVGTANLVVDVSTSRVTVGKDLVVNGDLYAKGLIVNTSQYLDFSNRSTTSGSEQTGYTTPWTSMRARSKVKLDVHIPFRNDGTGWGGSYHNIYMMVNKAVGTVAANTWVLLSSSGFYMTHYQDILSYENNYYIPLVVNEDFQIRFMHKYRVYNNGTLYINRSHHLDAYSDSRVDQFGLSTGSKHIGYSKFIVQEISG